MPRGSEEFAILPRKAWSEHSERAAQRLGRGQQRGRTLAQAAAKVSIIKSGITAKSFIPAVATNGYLDVFPQLAAEQKRGDRRTVHERLVELVEDGVDFVQVRDRGRRDRYLAMDQI